MAQKPDGKPKRNDRVTFTRPAAERIAKVVREVEGGGRDNGGLGFGFRGGAGGGKTFRICTFTGAWSKSQAKVVTVISTTATASAINLFANLTASNNTRNCAIAKDGDKWYLIAAEC